MTKNKIDKSDTEKLVGVNVDKMLVFDDHISDIFKKVAIKLST